MTKLTWRGPDDYEAGETPPSSCTWNGITFPVGVAVEVDNPTMVAKARGNRMFKVEGEPPKVQWREPATEADPADANPIGEWKKEIGADEEKRFVAEFTGLDYPPDYPPEDEPKRKRGRPPNKVRTPPC